MYEGQRSEASSVGSLPSQLSNAQQARRTSALLGSWICLSKPSGLIADQHSRRSAGAWGRKSSCPRPPSQVPLSGPGKKASCSQKGVLSGQSTSLRCGCSAGCQPVLPGSPCRALLSPLAPPSPSHSSIDRTLRLHMLQLETRTLQAAPQAQCLRAGVLQPQAHRPAQVAILLAALLLLGLAAPAEGHAYLAQPLSRNALANSNYW